MNALAIVARATMNYCVWKAQNKTSPNPPVCARRLNPCAPRGSAALRRAAPPKHGARPGWPRPCFVSRRPLAANFGPTNAWKAPRAPPVGRNSFNSKSKKKVFINIICKCKYYNEMRQFMNLLHSLIYSYTINVHA